LNSTPKVRADSRTSGSAPWYERLLGEPTFFPHSTEAVWTLAEDRSVYVVEHPTERATPS